MNPREQFERCLDSLREAALDKGRWPAASARIDEACGTKGSSLVVGERSGGENRIHFARLLYRGECRDDLAREYFDVHYAGGHGHAPPHVPSRGPAGASPPTSGPRRSAKHRRCTTRDTAACAPRNGLNAHFDDPDGLRPRVGDSGSRRRRRLGSPAGSGS